MGGARILVLDDDSFDAEIQQREEPILVDFWADWCAPCKRIAPALAELAIELAGRAVVAQVDVAANGDLVSRFGIRNIPTLIVFKRGRVVDQMVGAAHKAEIARWLAPHLEPGV